MKKRLTRAAKLCFVAPFLLFAIVSFLRFRLQPSPDSIVLPELSGVNALKFSPDGKRLLALVKGTENWRIGTRIYDVESRSEICELATPSNAGLDFFQTTRLSVAIPTFRGRTMERAS